MLARILELKKSTPDNVVYYSCDDTFFITRFQQKLPCHELARLQAVIHVGFGFAQAGYMFGYPRTVEQELRYRAWDALFYTTENCLRVRSYCDPLERAAMLKRYSPRWELGLINLIGNHLRIDWSRSFQHAVQHHFNYRIIGPSLADWLESEAGERAKADPEAFLWPIEIDELPGYSRCEA